MIEIDKSNYGRRLKVQFNVTDWSGHEGLLDEIERYQGTLSELGLEALALWASQRGQVSPIAAPSRITAEMRELLSAMKASQEQMKARQKQLEEMQALIVDMLANAKFSSPDSAAQFSQRMEDIQKMSVLEGAANYGGNLYETPQDDEFGDW